MQGWHKSSVFTVTIVYGMFVCNYPVAGGNSFAHKNTNTISSMITVPDTLLNFKQIPITLAHYSVIWI